MTEQPGHNHAIGSEHTYTAASEYAALADAPPVRDDEGRSAMSALEVEEVAQEQRMAQEGWLERDGLLEDARRHRLTMTRREYKLLKGAGFGDGGDLPRVLLVKPDKTTASHWAHNMHG
jgi:hypothetical protein